MFCNVTIKQMPPPRPLIFTIFEYHSLPMRFRFLLLVCASSLSIACSDRDASKSLSEAELFMPEHPDSALAVLDRLSPDCFSPRNKARYSLLSSMALDKNYIDITDDSLIINAVNYYAKQDGCKERMLSLYYHGLVLKNAKAYPNAMVELEKAERLADEMQDPYQLGLIHRNKADIYNACNNIPAAISSLQKAVDCFDSYDNKEYYAYAKLSLAISLLNNKQFQEALRCIQQARNDSDSENYQYQCDLVEADILTELGSDDERALHLFKSLPTATLGNMDWAYGAILHERKGEHHLADIWLNTAYERCIDAVDSATVHYMESHIRIMRGDVEEALRLQSRATSVQDSLTRVILQESLRDAQKEYYKNEANLQSETTKRLRITLTSCILTAILLILFLSALLIINKQRKDQFIKEMMAENAIRGDNSPNAALVGALFTERFEHLNQLTDIYFKGTSEKQKEDAFSQYKRDLNAFGHDKHLFDSLEEQLNQFCGDIMKKLKEQVPSIKGEKRKIIALFFAQVPYKTIMLIFNKNSVESLRMMRSRFRKEIEKADTPDKELFLSMLSVKNTATGKHFEE